MSKSITIPADRGNPVVVTINGKTYSYSAGSTQTVPDEVADLLSNSEALKPVPGGAGTPLRAAGLYDGDDYVPVFVASDGSLRVKKSDIAAVVEAELPEAELPAVTSDDDGSVLTVVDGVWAAVAPEASST